MGGGLWVQDRWRGPVEGLDNGELRSGLFFRWRTSRPTNFRPLILQTGSESTRFLENAFVHQWCCNGLCATHGFKTPLAGRLGDKQGKDKGAVRPSNAKRVGYANQISATESVHTSRWNFRIQRVHISHKFMHEFVPAIF